MLPDLGPKPLYSNPVVTSRLKARLCEMESWVLKSLKAADMVSQVDRQFQLTDVAGCRQELSSERIEMSIRHSSWITMSPDVL